MKPGDPCTVTLLMAPPQQTQVFPAVVLDVDDVIGTVEVTTPYGARIWLPASQVKEAP